MVLLVGLGLGVLGLITEFVNNFDPHRNPTEVLMKQAAPVL
jgi:hypothetical protein